jgi:hypothetical protein
MGEYYAPMGTAAFEENDLVLGFLVRPGTQRPLLYEFKRVVGLGGGKTFVQMTSDADMDVYDLMVPIRKAMDATVESGNKIRFNLDFFNYDYRWSAANERGWGTAGYTELEVGYIHQNWGGRFNANNVVWYRKGIASARPPWE